MYITVPTTITKEQYAAGHFAINIVTGDNYIFFGNDHQWVDKETDRSWRENYEGFPVQNVTVIGEHGASEEIEAYIVPTSEANELDLDELAKGHIAWR